jgi:hypothetical protein
MANHYLDVETTGLDPEKDKIITIQFQKMDNFGNPIGDLVILKEWEEGEEEIVRKFHKLITTNNPFFFIPVIQNHIFDFRFLFTKFKKYNLSLGKSEIDFLYDMPIIDIHSLMVMINRMNFKGSSLTNMTEKEGRGDLIPILYQQKEFKKIEAYIRQETTSFFKAFKILCRELPKLKILIQKQDGS